MKPAAEKSTSRPSWNGMLRFGLVSFPVESFNAHLAKKGGVQFHQLHEVCHRRIRYEKHCPIHGRVSNDEIISGYEVAEDQYVEVTPDELKALKTDQKHNGLTIDTFVPLDHIDPIYLDGRMYLLTPKGEEAEEPYAVFLTALERQRQCGLGRVLFSGKQQLVLLRPYQHVLHMAMLNYAVEIRSASDVWEAKRGPKPAAKKVELAERLIETWQDDRFDYSKYKDDYLEQLNDLLKDKIAGKEVVASPDQEEEPQVVNLMDALKASLRRKPGASSASRRAKAPRPKAARKPAGKPRKAS